MAKGDGLFFLKTFLRHPSLTGAIAPSSPALARAMVRDLRPGPGEGLLEFGPGTGAFTGVLQGLLKDPSLYLGIEREPRFVARLRERFPGLRFVEGSAEQASELVRTQGIPRLSAVVSGLPFASLPHPIQEGIHEALRDRCGPGVEFRTFQYVHAYGFPRARRFRRRMAETFGPPRRWGPVLWNLPPAWVLCWRGEPEPPPPIPGMDPG